MAAYTELFALAGDASTNTLRQKITIAIIIKANAIAKLPTPTAAQKDFARNALLRPDAYLNTILYYVLADNASATSAQITGASDTLVQTAVNAAVDTLLGV